MLKYSDRKTVRPKKLKISKSDQQRLQFLDLSEAIFIIPLIFPFTYLLHHYFEDQRLQGVDLFILAINHL